MNIILLSNDLQETDLLQQELGKLAPTIQIEVRHSAQEATSHISASNPCDAILLDASFPREDAVNLVLSIRREKKPIGIVALADTADKNPPIDLFKAGVDNFILKRPGYHSQLEEALKQAKERHKADTGPHARQSHVLYAGDTKKIQPHLAGVPHLHVVSVAFAPDGLLKIPQTGSPQNAVLIIDSAACSGNPLNAVKDVNLRVPELPIIFLSEVDDEQGLIQAMRAGASDCIAKTEGYLQRLTHAIEREVKHRESVLEKTALRAREERLRQIVENIPVGVTVIAPDGTFMAVNRAGLKLMGAVRLEQLVGKNFLQLLSREEQEKTLAFLSTISRGVSASVRLDWKGLDGTIAGMELRAVPMRRDAAGTTAALAAIYPPGGLRSAAVSDDASQNRQEEMISALQESEARLRELQDNSNLDRLKHEEALRQLETRCAAADQQLAVLTNSIAEYEARNKSLLEEQQAERASWEMTREGLKEQCAKIETMAESLRSAQDSLVETHSAERTQWQSKLQELESRRQEAEERLAQISELHNSDTSRQDEIQRDLDQRIHEAELTRSNLEAALQDVEARLARQMEALAAERELREIARQESSHKIGEAESLRAALEASLREADARFTQLAEELNTERSLHESARLGFEQKIQEAENTRAALEASLREVDARFTQQAEELNTERSLHESARLEFEQKIQEVENTRAALEESLREADARFTQQAEELNAERSLHQSARLEFEQKIQEAENTRAALEASLREADARFTQQAEELNTERSLRESARLEFEQKIQEVENTRAALEASLREADARFTQLAEELNAERSLHQSARLEFEQKIQEVENTRAALEASLREADARFTQLAEELNTERSLHQSVRLEFEQKIQEAENTRAALEASLREADARFAQQAQESDTERAHWDTLRSELEEKQKETEIQRTSLQMALDEVEAYLSQQVENHSEERSQWNFDRLDLEQKCLAGDEQRTALQLTLQETESRLAERLEEKEREQAQWNALRLELEQKCQAGEQRQQELYLTIQESESRCTLLSKEILEKADQLNAATQQLEHVQAEQNHTGSELAELQARYHALSHFSSAGVLLATLNGQVRECNDSAARMFGYSGAEEAQYQSGNYRFSLYAFDGALKNRLLQDGRLDNVEWSSLTRTGQLIRIHENSKLLPSGSGEEPRVERILTDISRDYGLGEEIRRARRMESTTDLAAATIKSMQELCTSLVSRGELLAGATNDTTTIRNAAEGLLNDAKRGIKHARQFFSTIQKAERIPETINLNEALTDNELLLRSLLGEDIDLQTALSPRLGLVFTIRQELVQLISNLMTSSREALPLGGTVVIETSTIEIEPLPSNYPPNMRPGIYVLLMIAADGCSVYPERRIGFIQTLVERMGGLLETANNTQAGNIHKVYLPRVERFIVLES